MSEVVVRMEMPKSCNDCGLAVDGWCYAILATAPQPGDLDFVKRPDWCPILCALPEQHGDLVDYDEVKKELEKLLTYMEETPNESGTIWFRRETIIPHGYEMRFPIIVPTTNTPTNTPTATKRR